MADTPTAGRGSFCDMARREATVEDLYKIADKAEIVNGELVIMTPAGGLHGYAAGAIYASLFEYARRTKRGYALPTTSGSSSTYPIAGHSALTWPCGPAHH